MISALIHDAISVADLRSCLLYRAEDGALIWRDRPDIPANINRRLAGRRAGHLHPNGYRSLSFRKRTLREQRVVWAVVFGEWPEGLVDHINGDTSDNRVENLRIASPAQNAWNRVSKSSSKTGSKGICWNPKTRKYRVSIMAHGVRKQLGGYPTLAEAEAVYAKAAQHLHGEFVRGAPVDFGVIGDRAFEIVLPPHPQEGRAANRHAQIRALYEAGKPHGAIVLATKLSRATVSRHLAVIRAGTACPWGHGSRILLDREGA